MMLLSLRLLSRLPLALLHALGAFAGVLAYAAVPGFRRKTRDNLETAGLYSRSLAWRSAAHAGMGTLELAWVWFRPLAQVLALTDARQLGPATDGAAANGRIFLTPHIGCFELSAKAFSTFAPMTIIYKAPRRDDLHRLLQRARAHPGLTFVPADASGVRALFKALRRGEAIGILPDQVPTVGEGEWAPFFGRPAFTMTLASRLAERSGAAVYMLASWRLPRAAGWRIDVRPIDDTPTPERINREVEAIVRIDPRQYYWSYNRFKVPQGSLPAAAGLVDGAGA
ncbi:MAG: lysophospholipid acyltransferase family protein [Lautropia sp.]